MLNINSTNVDFGKTPVGVLDKEKCAINNQDIFNVNFGNGSAGLWNNEMDNCNDIHCSHNKVMFAKGIFPLEDGGVSGLELKTEKIISDIRFLTKEQIDEILLENNTLSENDLLKPVSVTNNLIVGKGGCLVLVNKDWTFTKINIYENLETSKKEILHSFDINDRTTGFILYCKNPNTGNEGYNYIKVKDNDFNQVEFVNEISEEKKDVFSNQNVIFIGGTSFFYKDNKFLGMDNNGNINTLLDLEVSEEIAALTEMNGNLNLYTKSGNIFYYNVSDKTYESTKLDTKIAFVGNVDGEDVIFTPKGIYVSKDKEVDHYMPHVHNNFTPGPKGRYGYEVNCDKNNTITKDGMLYFYYYPTPKDGAEKIRMLVAFGKLENGDNNGYYPLIYGDPLFKKLVGLHNMNGEICLLTQEDNGDLGLSKLSKNVSENGEGVLFTRRFKGSPETNKSLEKISLKIENLEKPTDSLEIYVSTDIDNPNFNYENSYIFLTKIDASNKNDFFDGENFVFDMNGFKKTKDFIFKIVLAGEVKFKGLNVNYKND